MGESMKGLNGNNNYIYLKVTSRELRELEQGLKVLGIQRNASRNAARSRKEREGKVPAVGPRMSEIKLRIMTPADLLAEFGKSRTLGYHEESNIGKSRSLGYHEESNIGKSRSLGYHEESNIGKIPQTSCTSHRFEEDTSQMSRTSCEEDTNECYIYLKVTSHELSEIEKGIKALASQRKASRNAARRRTESQGRIPAEGHRIESVKIRIMSPADLSVECDKLKI
jgi:hypothetical protein